MVAAGVINIRMMHITTVSFCHFVFVVYYCVVVCCCLFLAFGSFL